MPIIKPENPCKIIMEELSWCGGSHICIEKTLYDTVLSAVNSGMNCFQFFLGSPQSYTRRKCDLDDITRAVKLAKDFNIMVVSHTCYLYNLNGSANQLCWSGDKAQDGKTISMIKQLEYELSVLSNFERNAVVIHPGSYKNRIEGMNTIIKTLNKIKFSEGSMLLLENCAGEGNKIPKDFKEIKYILDRIEHKDNIGVCLDTAHIHGQGDYNLSKPEEVLRMFKEFDKIIGLGKLKLIHLNDSEVTLGAKKDKHELIGHGKIWGESMKGFETLILFCKDKKIPTVLETSPDDMNTLFLYDEKLK
jgi:deoxyribonuclease IV